MKKILILILICSVQNIFSQSKEIKKTPDDLKDNLENYKSEEIISDENQLYNSTGLEVIPEFPGGYDAFINYLKTNFITPKEKPNLKGKIYTTFIIEKDGSLSGIKILRDIGYGSGAEFIKTMRVADWKKLKVDLHNRPTIFIIHKM